jgi:hypothetical protein
VTDVIPSGNDDMKGDEVDRIIQFKNALGIEDPDAAAVHIEVYYYSFYVKIMFYLMVGSLVILICLDWKENI